MEPLGLMVTGSARLQNNYFWTDYSVEIVDMRQKMWSKALGEKVGT